MKTRLSTLVTALLFLALVVAACGPTAEPTTPRVQQTAKALEATQIARGTASPEGGVTGTVTLWHSWKEEEVDVLNQVIAAFQEMNPEIGFDILYVPFDDLRGTFEKAAASGGGPTVLIGAADWGPALYDAEFLADISTLTNEAFLRTINAAALGAVRYRNALIGLPQTIDGVVMFRNTAIIPEAPATWEDLVAAALSVTEGDVVGANLERGFFFSAAHLNGIGGQMMDEDGDPLFNDERGVEWLNLLNSFADAGPAEYYTDDDVTLFQAGKAGIIIDDTWNMKSLAEAIGAENLAIDDWPSYADGSLSGYVQTENIYLSANAEGGDKEVGWAFMEFFLTPEAQELLTQAGHIPAILVEPTDPLMRQAVTALEGGTVFPVVPEMGAYWEPMESALQLVFDEGVDPSEALQSAYDSVVANIEEIRGQ